MKPRECSTRLTQEGNLIVAYGYDYEIQLDKTYTLCVPAGLEIPKHMMGWWWFLIHRKPNLQRMVMAYWFILRCGDGIKSHADDLPLTDEDKDLILRIFLYQEKVSIHLYLFYYLTISRLHTLLKR